MNGHRGPNLWRGVLATLLCSLFAGTALAPLPGAIFTTTKNGQVVNGNIYSNKKDVYLNGGPQPNAPQTAAGLPDGIYYFQVTDPSGKTLLSSDDISQRKFKVDNGLIVAWTGTKHKTGYGKWYPSVSNNISVQLMPYNNTPNPGGEYKVWATPCDKYAPGEGVHGFIHSWSKTDNFKVKERHSPPFISGFKWYDTNMDAVWDFDEDAVQGFRVVVTWYDQPDQGGNILSVFQTHTGGLGAWSSIAPEGAKSFEACEVLPLGNWQQTAPVPGESNQGGGAVADASRCWVGNIGTSNILNLNFGNVCVDPGDPHTLGFWHNKNGEAAMLDGGTLEPELALLRSKNLRNGNGTNFNPYTFIELSNWLVGANGSNMANMLSAQFAAMTLNVEAGFVSASAMIYAPGTNSANGAGWAVLGALLNEANTSLGLYGNTPSGHVQRAHQTAVKDALDRGNNNIGLVNILGPGDCDVVYLDEA